MHIIMANTVYMDGILRTPVARHVSPGTMWQDTISGDGKSVLTIIYSELPDAELIAIQLDADVIDHLEISRPLDQNLPPAAAARVMRLAAKHGFPVDALPSAATVADVRDAVIKRMIFSQVVAGADIAEAAKIKSVLRRRLIDSDFDVSEISEGDDEQAIRKKVLKHKGGKK